MSKILISVYRNLAINNRELFGEVNCIKAIINYSASAYPLLSESKYNSVKECIYRLNVMASNS
jgi:hypothetical protein